MSQKIKPCLGTNVIEIGDRRCLGKHGLRHQQPPTYCQMGKIKYLTALLLNDEIA